LMAFCLGRVSARLWKTLWCMVSEGTGQETDRESEESPEAVKGRTALEILQAMYEGPGKTFPSASHS
jgi:hypothetical protein